MQTLDVHFRDTWRLALGATQRVSPTWKLKYGLAYDQTPVRDAAHRLVSLPDNDRTWISLGAQWSAHTGSALDLGLAYLFIGDAAIDNDQRTFGRGRVAGNYGGSVLILGAQYAKAF